jgi:hypothetical protein
LRPKLLKKLQKLSIFLAKLCSIKAHRGFLKMIMMKKTSLFVLRATALASMAVALSAHALQTVTPVKDAGGTAFAGGTTAGNLTSWTTTAGLGTTVTVIGRYSDGSSGNEAGLGLKVKYDETKLTGVTVTALNTKCMIAPPQVQPAGATSQAVMGWIETSKRAGGAVGWPALADLASPDGCLSPNTPANETGAASPTLNLFQFTGTLAPSVGLGGTADILITADGNFSYAGAGPGMNDQKITVTAAAAPSIAISSVVSRKAHGPAGGPFVNYDLPLPNFGGSIGGAIDVEPRLIGTGHKIVFVFNSAVTSVGTPTLAAGTGLLAISGASAAAAISGNEVTVTLTGVPDIQRVKVSLPGVNGALSVAANVGFLVGDVNGSLQTTGTDVNPLKAAVASSTAVGPTTFKFDVNADGSISGTDVNAVKARAASSPGPL